MPEIVVNGRGDQREVPQLEDFPDKKEVVYSYEEVTQHILKAAEIRDNMEVGQEEATWLIHQEYPPIPIMVTWMTDIHYGHIGTDYKQLDKHFKIIEETPNAYAIIGGDCIDNFAIKHAHAGIMGDAIPPQVQAQVFMKKLLSLDRIGKIGALVYGNHEDWLHIAGMDFYNTFMGDFHAPIFHKGGVLHTVVSDVNYNIGITHKHWGVSKLNITNSPKRAMTFSFPGVDVMLTGDDHQSGAELFSMAGERKLAIDGGTYKLHDSTGQKWGLGPPGSPGYTLILFPVERKIEFFDDPEVAQQFLTRGIFHYEVAHGQRERTQSV